MLWKFCWSEVFGREESIYFKVFFLYYEWYWDRIKFIWFVVVIVSLYIRVWRKWLFCFYCILNEVVFVFGLNIIVGCWKCCKIYINGFEGWCSFEIIVVYLWIFVNYVWVEWRIFLFWIFVIFMVELFELCCDIVCLRF